ncbi:hypothetical protein FIBSPDRAFT_961081 [Athelia psychrophila]|uniref:Uncharacterized protein n=1 Tax=Athelia psychrophila TaxID=1759441 RepID=A0A166BLG5_9AGAM|nr:hypothetical protein FIBSPDRAFT_961081 [Fibularhizoctonia sp. CBS 109695]
MGGIGMGGMGSYTPVHTTFVPPLAALARKGGREQGNLNPNLTAQVPQMIERGIERAPSPPIAEPSMFVQTPATVAKPSLANTNANIGNLGAFDAFADMNPFTLKTLDAYRMQLWGKMAAQRHLYQLHQHQQQPQLTQRQQQMLQQQLNAAQQQQQQQISGLAQAMRPAFFRDAGLAGMLAGKGASATSSASPSSSYAAYPSPPSTPKLSAAAAGARAERESMQRDAIRSSAKLGNAFLDAFSDRASSSSALPSSSSSSSAKQWDAEKVRKVLEGKVVVRVVDVEQPAPKASAAVGAGVKADVKAAACGNDYSLTKVLEEGMRGLTLAGKSTK